ncbi:hypothetical protein CU304_04635 [Prochlorococcus marinus str. MU1415]|nr:hypothetical protein [Prochlorococcus marinus str. MU1415]
MKIFLTYKITKLVFRKEKLVVSINILLIMFKLRELKIMFLDPTDLLVDNINIFLSSNKTIKLIFS